MKREILDYIKSQRVGVLALEMLDGSPHAATVHFANTEEPLVFFFETDRNYRKSEPLFGREITRASFVVGFEEGKLSKTFQLDGTVQLVKSGEKELVDEIYLGKFPEKKEKAKGPNVVFFTFTPTWWRFTDWNAPQGKVITTSEDK